VIEVKEDMRRVAILIPAGDECKTAFAISLAHMIRETLLLLPENLEALTINSFCTAMLPFSRQILAETALQQGATHLLWIDSDMKFPADMLMTFLRHDKPIIGINAMARSDPWNNTAQSAPDVPLVTTPVTSWWPISLVSRRPCAASPPERTRSSPICVPRQSGSSA